MSLRSKLATTAAGLAVALMLAGCGAAATPTAIPSPTTEPTQVTVPTEVPTTVPTDVPTDVPTEVPTDTAVPVVTSTPVEQPTATSVPIADQPPLVVKDFLATLQLDPSGKSSVAFLASNLAAEVKAGKPVSSLLGIRNIYLQFTVKGSDPAPGDQTATVAADLEYQSGIESRIFTLVQENGWRIQKIEANPVGSGTEMPSPRLQVSPAGGRAGTKVTVQVSNFKPGTLITIRIGLPKPIGEGLGGGQVAADGTWSGTVIIPATLPSGQPITSTNMNIVAMDQNNQVIAMQGFTFAP